MLICSDSALIHIGGYTRAIQDSALITLRETSPPTQKFPAEYVRLAFRHARWVGGAQIREYRAVANTPRTCVPSGKRQVADRQGGPISRFTSMPSPG